MITNDPNTNLIEAMKEKLPLKGKLADMLMDTLYIGKVNPEKPDVPLNKNDAFQKVQKRRVQEKR